MPPDNICNLDPAFFEACLNASNASVEKSYKPYIKSTDSTHLRLTASYPDAFTDFHGMPGGGPCIYKTGPAWPKPERGPEMQPYVREMRPVHGHPITPIWCGFLKDTQAYLDAELGIRFTAIMGFGFANTGEKTPFCPFLVIIGVPPHSLAFEATKKAADYIKGTILSQAGFPDIDVAVREWMTW